MSTTIVDELTTPVQTFREKRIEAMRAYADFMEANPSASPHWSAGEVMAYTEGPDDMAQKARELGGRWEKSTTDYYFYLQREVSPGTIYKLYASRDLVCERVQVGEETVEVPDPEALKAVPKIAKTQPKYEWRCPDSLLEMTQGEGEAG